MARELDQAPTFSIGKWRADPSLCTLSSGEVTHKIEPRLMRLLSALAKANGGLVTKERIITDVWDREEIGDDTIASAVSRLRRAMGDDARQQSIIRTVSRRGYALSGPIFSETTLTHAGGLDAVTLCLRGREVLRLGTPQGLEQARVYFEAAKQASPSNADGHAGFACVRLTQFFAGYASRDTCLEPALVAAQDAVRLDPASSLGWAACGFALLISAGDPIEAEQCFQSALSNGGDHGIAYRWYSLFLIARERFDEAEVMARRAIAHEPFSLAAFRVLIQVLLAARRHKIVLQEATSALALSESEPAIWFWMGCAHKFLEQEAAAYAAFRRSFSPTFEVTMQERCDAAFARDGLRGFFKVVADKQEERSATMRPIDRAVLCTFAGDFAKAIRFLESAHDHGDPQLAWFHVLPHFDDLRGRAAFDRLVRSNSAESGR